MITQKIKRFFRNKYVFVSFLALCASYLSVSHHLNALPIDQNQATQLLSEIDPNGTLENAINQVNQSGNLNDFQNLLSNMPAGSTMEDVQNLVSLSAISNPTTNLSALQNDILQFGEGNAGQLGNLIGNLEGVTDLGDFSDEIAGVGKDAQALLDLTGIDLDDLIQASGLGGLSDQIDQLDSALGDIQNGDILSSISSLPGLEGVFDEIEGLDLLGDSANQVQGIIDQFGNVSDFFGGGDLNESLGDALSGATGGGSGGGGLGGGGSGGGGSGGGGSGGGGSGGGGGGSSCSGCDLCDSCAPDIQEVHEEIKEHVTEEFINHRAWLVDDFFFDNIVPALMLMTSQLTAVGIEQVAMIGQLFDAKHQLETQRLFQQKVAEAHKDYHPSEEMCEITTSVIDLASSEKKSDLVQLTYANRMMQRQLLSQDNLSGKGERSDRESRLKQFREVYCNPNDNAGFLTSICGQQGGLNRNNGAQVNMDVNYTSTIENKLTLELDFVDIAGTTNLSMDEENVFALDTNLFGNQVLTTITDRLLADGGNMRRALTNFYIKQRALAAKRSVAQNSYTALVAMRAAGEGKNAPYLKAMIRDLGVGNAEIEDYLGGNPSYFAQMEILTKKMYQSPKFYANLYDKPVNIERKGAALQAIAIMQDRDIYDSLLRSEAVLATLLETLIHKEHDRISRDLSLVKLPGERIQ